MLPLVSLSTDGLADAFARRMTLLVHTDGTGKLKVDGSKAATRLGSSVTETWCNERFRQVMLLVREFRMEWPAQSLLTADDVENIRWLLDCAMYTASRVGHKGDIYDMNPTCYAIWLVQNQHALKAGGWQVETARAQQMLSFEGLYRWLEAQHARGDSRNLYAPVTKKLLKRYKLPFKKFTVPPEAKNLFKYIKGARRLSAWIHDCQQTANERDRPRSMELAFGVIMQRPPALVAPPPQAAAAEARRQAIWNRVVARAQARRPLRTAQEDTEDAEQTRRVVAAVVGESNRAPGAESTESEDELERELEAALADGEGGQQAGSSSQGGARAEDRGEGGEEPRGMSLEEIQEQLMRDDD